MRVLLALAFIVSGCGARSDIGEVADASPRDDASSKPRCDVTAAFGPASPLASLNTNADEIGIALTNDELSALVIRRITPQSPQLFVFARASTADAFVPKDLSGVDTVPLSATMTDDQLTLVLSCSAGWQLPYTLCEYQRQDVVSPFAAVPISLIVPSHAWAFTGGGLYANPTATTIYYDSISQGIVRATRDTVTQDFTAVSQVTVDLGSDAGGITPQQPVFTPDERTMFFHGGQAPPAPGIWEARRQSATGAFTEVRPVSELSTNGGEAAQWISPDGCRLYFSRGVPDGSGWQADLYVAARP